MTPEHGGDLLEPFLVGDAVALVGAVALRAHPEPAGELFLREAGADARGAEPIPEIR